ncbi:MAG: hypothetical protein O8C64_03595 [Candidatus Methanoperedens sp.]|nr:hypothetical protein [Candidatus Methanoperedens sp.]MCZ7405601.1 hypothetical protein [Candidatus Methanoperedens sp.]
MNVNVKSILNEIMPLSLKEKTEIISWIVKSVEEDSLRLHRKDIRRYSGVLKSKRDALKFERDIRNEWDRKISY